MFESDPEDSSGMYEEPEEHIVPAHGFDEEGVPPYDGYVSPDIVPEYNAPDDGMDSEVTLLPTPEDPCKAAYDKCNALIDENITAMLVEGSSSVGIVEQEILAGRILQAVAKNDLETATSQVALYRELQASPKYGNMKWFSLIFAATVAGDEVAASDLHEILENEQLKRSLNRVASSIEGAIQDDSDFPDTELYDKVIALCAEQGMPADTWINTYALDDNERWAKTAIYLRVQAGIAGEDVAAAQQSFDAHAATLCSHPDNAFVAENGLDILRYTSDFEIRAQLTARMLAALESLPADLTYYKVLMDLAAEIYADPLLSDVPAQEVVSYYDWDLPRLTLNQCQPFNDARYEAAEASMKYAGIAPEKVVENINAYARASTNDGSEQSMSQQAKKVRDERLSRFVEYYARNGDVAGVQTMLAHMSPGNDIQQHAHQLCMRLVKTQEELDIIKPSDAARVYYPVLAAHADIAEARIAGDVERIIAVAREHMQIKDVPEIAMRGVIAAAYQAANVRGTEHGAVFAKQLLPSLREANMEHRDMRYLSDALIEAGDPDEPAAALAYISSNARFRQRLFRDLWELAKTLSHDTSKSQ
jgi:hypothetical protein